jgi:predicted dehydrogenase
MDESPSSGKHLFTEKPLCHQRVPTCEIATLHLKLTTQNSKPPLWMVCLTARFSPLVRKMKETLVTRNFRGLRIKAGVIPKETWFRTGEKGGGRIVGERSSL